MFNRINATDHSRRRRNSRNQSLTNLAAINTLFLSYLLHFHQFWPLDDNFNISLTLTLYIYIVMLYMADF